MKATEIKEEIYKLVETMPEKELEDALTLLRQLTVLTKEQMREHPIVKRILAKDKGLLEKLAK